LTHSNILSIMHTQHINDHVKILNRIVILKSKHKFVYQINYLT